MTLRCFFGKLLDMGLVQWFSQCIFLIKKCWCKSISSSAQYVTLQKIFAHLILVIIIIVFPTPPVKLKLRLQIGVRLLIANHLDQSLRPLKNREHQVKSYLLHSSLATIRLWPFYQAQQSLQNSCQIAIFWLCSSNFNSQGTNWSPVGLFFSNSSSSRLATIPSIN